MNAPEVSPGDTGSSSSGCPETSTSAEEHPRPGRAVLHPTIRAAGWVSLFTDLGSELIYPILPLYLTSQLRASKSVLGLIEGLAEGTPAIVRLFSGSLSDRVANRKGLIFTGYALSSLMKPFIGLAGSAWQVLPLRFLDRVGKGIRGAPRDALVADHADPSQCGYAFGYQRGMDHLGAMLGSLLAFVLLAWLDLTLSQIVLFSIVPGLICLLAIALFIQEVPGRKVLPAATRRPIWPARGELSPAYYRFLAAAGLFALANSSDAFLLLRSHQMGVPAAGIPLLWALLHLVKTSTSVLGGRLSDRIGRRPVLIAGWLWYGFVYAGFGLAPASAWAWILFALYGLFFGLTEGAARAYVADLVPKSTRGKAYGLLSMTEGLLALPASLLFGLLWEWQDSHAPPFVLSGILAALAALILVQRNDKSGPPSVAGGHPRDPRDRFEATGG